VLYFAAQILSAHVVSPRGSSGLDGLKNFLDMELLPLARGSRLSIPFSTQIVAGNLVPKGTL
jgi:hypothetical protein